MIEVKGRLTPAEYLILKKLADEYAINPQRWVTSKTLLELYEESVHVHKSRKIVAEDNAATIRVLVTRLRNKTSKTTIENGWGHGYRLTQSVDLSEYTSDFDNDSHIQTRSIQLTVAEECNIIGVMMPEEDLGKFVRQAIKLEIARRRRLLENGVEARARV